MNRVRFLITAVFALALMVSVLGGSVTAQHDHGHGDHGTPEASPMAGADHGDHGADLSMGALYLVITNEGDDADRLVSVTTDAAEFVEVHQVNMDNNVMQMNPLHDGLEIPAGEEVVLEPGGHHIMLIGLTESLIAGEDYELIMTFEHAGEITVTVPILRTEPDDDEGKAGPVEVGELVIDGIWSRQAPKIDGGVATPVASPESTPAH
jgi:copper(I)-binding protein